MKIHLTYLICFVLLLGVKVNVSDATSKVDRLSNEDKIVYADYDQHHRNDPVEDLAITHLICNHIKSASSIVVQNAFVLFNRLSNKHKIYFDDVFIEYLIKEIKTGMTYREYLDTRSYFLGCLVTLGKTRSAKSIDLLFELMEPYENWPEPFKEALKNNPDQSIWITKIRKYALSSLLEPQDKKGEELLPQINAKLNSLQIDKEGFTEMKQAYSFYKDYYAKLREEGLIQ